MSQLPSSRLNEMPAGTAPPPTGTDRLEQATPRRSSGGPASETSAARQQSSHASQPEPPSAIPALPIVIGITGHRDIRSEDVQFLEGIVRATLVDIREKHPHCPLVVLSPLAEGGDRLTARVAVDMGVRLIVPLPLPLELYERDFTSEESRAEFHGLLSRAEGMVTMPLVPGNTFEGIREYGPQRNRQYAMVGAYIARHSQLFIALWDGHEPEPGSKEGGTAEIVRFRLQGAPVPYDPPRSPLTFADSGPVLHVVTPRQQDPTVHGEAFTRRNLAPRHRSFESLSTIYDHMDRFNRDAVELAVSLSPTADRSKAQLLQVEPRVLGHAVASLPRGARRVLEQYGGADALALHFGQKTLATSANLFGLIFIAALCFNIFHSFPHVQFGEEGSLAGRVLHMPWLLLAFVALFMYGSLVLHRRAVKGDYQNKYQDYRALAEALRIQFFWKLAGVDDTVVNRYLRKQRGELEWIRSALQSWDVLGHVEPREHHRDREVHADLLKQVRKIWVADQRHYFKSKAEREHRALERDERRVNLLLAISLALSAALAAILIVPHFLHIHVLEEAMHLIEVPVVHGTVMLLIVTLLVAAGLRHGYTQLLARSEHAKQFSRMSELFDLAERRLDELLGAGDHAGAGELLQELGVQALEENGDWVLLHRERPLEVPHAG